MKKKLISFFTVVFLALSFAKAQNPSNDCNLKAEFGYKPDNCTVAYMDKSSAGTGSTITKWLWSFGDGTMDTTQNPTHVYKLSGHYKVCLTVIAVNKAGKTCKEIACNNVDVKNCGSINDSTKCKLDAEFASKVDSCTVTFADQSKGENGTTITGWNWSFGDGTTSTNQNPSHVYAHNGLYNVCLTVVGKNAAGKECKDIQCHSVAVKGCGSVIDSLNCKLIALFKTKTDSCTVSFADVSSAGLGTTITKWYWNFGDGTVDSLQKNPVHTYAFNGNYNVCLTVAGKNSASGKECQDKECHYVEVKGCGPDTTQCKLKSRFEAKIDSCTVTFTDQSITQNGSKITRWYWTFGDGTVDSVQNPQHVYKKSGHYSVCLTVEGESASGKKCKDKTCHSVMVKGCGSILDSVKCKLAAMFKAQTDSCTVTFTDASSAGLSTTITKWYWSFGDGSVDSVQNPAPHTYKQDGIYNVCLTVVGKNPVSGKECKDKECRKIFIKGCAPDSSKCNLKSEFEYKIDSCTVTFTNKAAAGPGTSITKWFWSFGDGSMDSVQNPTHVYAHDGHYNVCLVVVGKNAATGKFCKERACHFVDVKGCAVDSSECGIEAKFDYTKDSTKVTFDNQTVSASGTVIKKWYWTFGDGSIDSVENPVHIYAKPGKYKVCLIVVGVNLSGKECKEMSCANVNVGQIKQKSIQTQDAAGISMLQLFPNPATDVVTIQFKVDMPGQVNITITDIQGRVLSVAQDGYMTAGYHNVGWNVDVKAGLYIVTIKTSSGIEQKQLLIQQH